MDRIDTARIIREARELRAVEMQRLQGQVAKRLGLYFRRPAGPGLANRANHLLRALFSGNPHAHRF